MKRILSYISICALAAVVFAGCAKDAVTDGSHEGKGRLVFSVKFDGQDEATRAEGIPVPDDYTVKVANSEGYIYIFNSKSDVPSELWLLSGTDYSVTVEGGSKTAYSWDTPYYKGTKDFVITDGANTSVTVECDIQNTLFAVGFDESVTTQLSDYSLTLYPVPGDDSKTLVFDENNIGDVAYVMLESGQTTMEWAFNAADAERGAVSKAGELKDLEAGKKYELSFKYTKIERTGRFDMAVSVDESVASVADNIYIYQRPRIDAQEFDLAETQMPAASYEIVASGSSAIKSIILSGSVFGAGYDLLDAANNPSEYGMPVVPMEGDKVSFSFTMALFNMMPGGLNEIAIRVIDVNNKETPATFKITTSGTSVSRGNVWATFATLSGTVLEDGDKTVIFGYRPSGSGEWQYTGTAANAGTKYSAKATGLTPGTAYETCIMVNGVFKGTPVGFTTEAPTQLPNGGFEEWNQTSDVWYANASMANKFWDSGNQGSVKAPVIGSKNNNVTTGVADPRPGSAGSKSAQLKSNWFGVLGQGAFAAASLYTGNFLEARADLKNPSGRVEFGRPWSGGARPSAMKVWYKATLGSVNYAKDGAPISKGQTDKARIYIALADSGFPCEVDTAVWDNFIDYETDVRIVAFGELVVESNVANWTEYTINLKYRSLDRVPTHIVVVASASMYGDYFAGSTSSIMWIDDFELIYNDNIVLQD